MSDRPDPECLVRWPECADGYYDPRCCRFPKSCSASEPPEPPKSFEELERECEVEW